MCRGQTYALKLRLKLFAVFYFFYFFVFVLQKPNQGKRELVVRLEMTSLFGY